MRKRALHAITACSQMVCLHCKPPHIWGVYWPVNRNKLFLLCITVNNYSSFMAIHTALLHYTLRCLRPAVQAEFLFLLIHPWVGQQKKHQHMCIHIIIHIYIHMLVVCYVNNIAFACPIFHVPFPYLFHVNRTWQTKICKQLRLLHCTLRVTLKFSACHFPRQRITSDGCTTINTQSSSDSE